MSLLTEALAATSRNGGVCGVQLLLERMSESEQAELHEALASSVQGKALARALSNRGYVIAGQTINRHRRADCSCRS